MLKEKLSQALQRLKAVPKWKLALFSAAVKVLEVAAVGYLVKKLF